MKIYEFVELIDHPEVLGSEGFLNRQDSMAETSDFSALLMDVFHDLADDSQGVDLLEDRIDLHKTDTLCHEVDTFTCV